MLLLILAAVQKQEDFGTHVKADMIKRSKWTRSELWPGLHTEPKQQDSTEAWKEQAKVWFSSCEQKTLRLSG